MANNPTNYVVSKINGLEKYLLYYSENEQKIYSIVSHKFLATRTLDWYKYVEFRIMWKRFSTSIHRVIASVYLWLDLFNTEICVLHKNDIRDCNNIDNLFLWSKKDNYLDMVDKWRRKFLVRYWVNVSNSKLKDEDIVEIKKLLSNWVNQKIIWKQFWVIQQTISCINTWKIWSKWSARILKNL